jgi:Amt family ammonium transporter
MLEAGFVRKKNTSAILLKNIALYSIAGIMFYLVGYSLMYVDVSGYIGSLNGIFYNPTGDEIALLDGAENIDAIVETGYSAPSDWFFQMVFCATAVSIVSGACAERIKVWPFMIFAAIMTGLIYPIFGSWTWGGGWLAEMGFSDFAGSTIVHSVGGWAALTGCLILGARKGKYSSDGRVNPIAGANMPLATLGTFILWFGWFGFNGGSQLAMGSALDVLAISIVVVNTNIAACGGVVVAVILSQIMFKKIDLTIALNGAIAGLVAITAGPDLQNHFTSMLVGGIGGALSTFAIPLMDKFKIDDVVGAIPAHLVAGIWGTLAVGIFGNGDLGIQIIGILAAAILVIPLSAIFFLVLSKTTGLRISEEVEAIGMDSAELTTEAYPEFK